MKLSIVEVMKEIREKKNVRKDEYFSQILRAAKEKIAIGASFSPEQVAYLSGGDVKNIKVEALACLKTISNSFKVKDIRLGIRWSNVVKKRAKTVDLSFYVPYLDYCIKNNLNICLNLGPIKTFRWPEEHVPEKIIFKLVSFPERGSEVDLKSPIASYALSFLDELIFQLKKNYSMADLTKIKIIQPENEAFFAFGQYGWKMSEEYMGVVMKKITKEFPDKKLMLSSSGSSNIKQILTLFNRLDTASGRFVVGYNYYYRVPRKVQSPFIFVDSFTKSRENVTNLVTSVLEKAYTFEVTEAQCEPWGKITSPGNSQQEFKFMLARIVNNLPQSKEKIVVRLWGAEYLALPNTNYMRDRNSIKKIIREINS